MQSKGVSPLSPASTGSHVFQNPAQDVNVEQTASIFSRVFYTYVDPFVLGACKVTSLTTDELPPLCDTDDVKHLEDWTYQVCNPFPSLFSASDHRGNSTWTRCDLAQTSICSGDY